MTGYGEFGKWLQEQLELNGWNQSEFGRMIGVDQSKISRWCWHQGPYVELRGKSAQKIADGIGAPVELVLAKAGMIDPMTNEKGRALANLIMRIDWDDVEAPDGPLRAMLGEILSAQRAKIAREKVGG